MSFEMKSFIVACNLAKKEAYDFISAMSSYDFARRKNPDLLEIVSAKAIGRFRKLEKASGMKLVGYLNTQEEIEELLDSILYYADRVVAENF